MLSADDIEVDAQGLFSYLEVSRVELPVQTVSHGAPSKLKRLAVNFAPYARLIWFLVGMLMPRRYI